MSEKAAILSAASTEIFFAIRPPPFAAFRTTGDAVVASVVVSMSTPRACRAVPRMDSKRRT
jgi:hypothetical protein